jgi:uncharacterized membrane protein
MSEAGYRRELVPYPALPQLGCAMVALATFIAGAMLLARADLFSGALVRLHLSAPVAMFSLLGMVLGGMLNIPIYRWRRDDVQLVSRDPLPGLLNWLPMRRSSLLETILAVNLGGCVIPVALAIYYFSYVAAAGSQAQLTLLLAVVVNVAVCYRVARPVEGIGIILPGFIAPLAALGVTWLLLGWSDDYQNVRMPIACIAGIVGPLVGGHLLHLPDLKRHSIGVMSIGGPGAFDAVVLSCLAAALLA